LFKPLDQCCAYYFQEPISTVTQGRKKTLTSCRNRAVGEQPTNGVSSGLKPFSNGVLLGPTKSDNSGHGQDASVNRCVSMPRLIPKSIGRQQLKEGF